MIKRPSGHLMRHPATRAVLQNASRMPVLPTLLTLGNAVCGLGSISYAASAPPASGGNYLMTSGLLIFAGMVFDMLDGSAARWTKQATKFGGELDSLCDAITFGVAPAFIILQMANAYPPRIVWAIAALYMACTVLRLARFNVETAAEDKHDWFSGLPSPAAAATIAAFAIAIPPISATSAGLSSASQFSEAAVLNYVRNFVPIIGLVLAGLMVSRIRYPHIVKQTLQGKRQFRQVAQIVFAIAAIVALGELSAPLILCAFVIGAPVSATWNRFGRRKSTPPMVVSDPAAASDDKAVEIGSGNANVKPKWWATQKRPPRRRA
jgi:CDP-diacylglycerol--serine O-phosphatidyltransferase